MRKYKIAFIGDAKIGKTRLISEAFPSNVIKFEGLENLDSQQQKKHFVERSE